MNRERTLKVTRLGVVDYGAGLELQTSMVAARLRGSITDTLLLLEHPHVFTLGRGANESYLMNAPANIPVYRVSRGGQVTYHGPGQLIGYPILHLQGTDRDVIRYLRRLEQVMIQALARFAIVTGRRDGLTGVWAGASKIGSIGVGLRRWVTMHGFALNIRTDLRFFDAIVPCGIAGCRMTSVAALGHPEVSMTRFCEAMEHEFASVFEYERVVSGAPGELWNLLDSYEQRGNAQT
jgi:lipoate-protein ligase B